MATGFNLQCAAGKTARCGSRARVEGSSLDRRSCCCLSLTELSLGRDSVKHGEQLQAYL
jgi:hypothetical protein